MSSFGGATVVPDHFLVHAIESSLAGTPVDEAEYIFFKTSGTGTTVQVENVLKV